MATFLDALADLLVDDVQRIEYRRDPVTWLQLHRAGDLSGEDVAAAVPVLRTWVPALADRLTSEGAPDPAPLPGEREVDAAVRQIDHLLEVTDPHDVATTELAGPEPTIAP